MKKSFNLQKYIKTAFYEDARGYWNAQTRAWMNCYKKKSSKGIEPQKAWNSCLRDYQKATNKADWVLSYVGTKHEGPWPYLDAKTPAAQKIIKK